MDGRGVYGITNQNSIGVELCQDVNTGTNVWNWDFHATTRAQSILVFAYLMKEYNVPLSRVVRHYDASRKSCPGNWMANDWAKWKLWKKDLETYVTTGKLVDSQRGIVYDNGNTIPVKVEQTKTEAVKSAIKSVFEVAKEVISGKWGVGAKRKSNLESSGYNYNEVQSEVNKILRGESTAPQQSQPQPQVKKEDELLGRFIFNTTVKVRTAPELSADTYTGLLYRRGEVVNIEGNVIKNGYVWGTYKSYSGLTRYVALKEVDGVSYVRRG